MSDYDDYDRGDRSRDRFSRDRRRSRDDDEGSSHRCKLPSQKTNRVIDLFVE